MFISSIADTQPHFPSKNKTREGRTRAYGLTYFGELPLRQHRAARQGGRLRGHGAEEPGSGLRLRRVSVLPGSGCSIPRPRLQEAGRSCRRRFIQEPRPNRALTNLVRTLALAGRACVQALRADARQGFKTWLR